MSDSSLQDSLGHGPDGADLDKIGRTFLDHVKGLTQKAAEVYDDDAVRAEEKALRDSFPPFFDLTLLWVKNEMGRSGKEASHPDAAKLKTEAKSVLRALQGNIVDFAVVAMHINRFMTLVREEIKRTDSKGISYSGNKKIKWTGDTGLMLGRNKKRKQEIDLLNKKFAEGLPLLAQAEKDMARFETRLAGAVSREDADKLSGSFRAGLRVSNFARARSVLADIKKTPPKFTLDRKAAEAALAEVAADGESIVAFFEKNADNLRSEDGKVFMTASELRIVQDSLNAEERKIRTYIVKYNLPYMAYKLENLELLRDKLLVIGSLEGLMTLYLRLLAGLARPMKKLEDVRLYEAEVIGPIKFMQGGHFEEIKKIQEAAAKTVAEFRVARREYQDELDRLLTETGEEQLKQGLAEI